MGREREAKVSLGQRGDANTKNVGEVRGKIIGETERKEGSFMVVDGEARGKIIEDNLDSVDGFRSSMQKNQGVIRILQNRARRALHQRMADNRNERRLLQEVFKDVSNEDEQVRGERVALTEAVAIGNLATLDAIKEDGGFANAKKVKDPVALKIREATVMKDLMEAVPVDRIERFVEAEF